MIEDRLYRETILGVAQNPTNRGEIENPNLEARLVNPLCGDEIRLQIKLTNDQAPMTNHQKVERAVFSGNGCAISQASASLLASHIEGKKVEEVKNVKAGDILKLIGINPTPARMGCALLSLEVLKKLLTDYRLQFTASKKH